MIHFLQSSVKATAQLIWAKLSLILKYPASVRPPAGPGIVPEKLPRKLENSLVNYPTPALKYEIGLTNLTNFRQQKASFSGETRSQLASSNF